MALIRPSELTPAESVSNSAAVMIDTGSAVQKSTPLQIVDAGTPLASQAEAEAGADNAKRVTPLRVKQAIDAQAVSLANLSSTDADKGAALVGFEQTGLTDAEATTALKKLQERISLLDVLTDAERTDVLAGTNAIDITSKLATLLANVNTNRPGAIIDATMVRGTWAWTVNPFAGLPNCKAVLLTGNVTITKDFNEGPITLPSYFEWHALGRTYIQPTSRIATLTVDSSPGVGMVQPSNVSTTGTGTAGTKTVTAFSAGATAGMNIGAPIAIQGIYADPYVAHTLNGAINSSATAIAFNEDATSTLAGGVGTTATVYIKIDNEIILGTVNDAGAFTATQRGALGTTAASHSNGAAVSAMSAFLSTVTAVAGATITIADNLPLSFTSAYVRVGAIEGGLHGRFTIDGQFDRANIGSFFQGLPLTLTRWFRASGGIRILNCMHGGLFLFGAQDCTLEIDEISGCGRPADNLGASLWVFGRNYRNNVKVRLAKDGYGACFIDNKSNSYSWYALEGPAEHNRVEIGMVLEHKLESQTSGSPNNTLTIGHASTTVAGALVDYGVPQVNVTPPCSGNSIVTASQATERAPTGLALGNNLVSINGRSIRRVSVTHTVGVGGFTVAANTNYNYGITTTGVKAGDRIHVSPTAALAGFIGITAYSIADNSTRIIFAATNADVVVAAGTQFIVQAEGPW
jgi:hypothetical protein